MKARNRDTQDVGLTPTPSGTTCGPRQVCRGETHVGDGLCAKSGLKAHHFVLSTSVGLVAGQGHWLVLLWKAFKHLNVHKVIIHLNLDEEGPPSNPFAFELHSVEHQELLVFLLFQRGLHLVSNSLDLSHGQLLGRGRTTRHLGSGSEDTRRQAWSGGHSTSSSPRGRSGATDTHRNFMCILLYINYTQ